MTSEAIVSLFVGKLGDLISVGAESLFKMREEIEWIRRELRSLQSFLKDADDATHKENARLRNWVQEIRDIAYDAEDIIDSYIVNQADRLGFMGHVKRWIPMADELTTLQNVFEQIQKIRSRITDLSSNMQAFHIDIDVINNEGGGRGGGSSSSRALRDYRWIRAHFKEPDMVGMQGDIKTLKDRLMDGDPNRRVVSIVGMGGSGFIQQEGITVMSEDLAEDYLEELIDRSMIQVAARRTNGSVRTCRIHDLLRDLSIFEAKENNFFAIQADNGTNEGLSSVRRLALYCDTEMNEAINCPTTALRSMLCFSDRAIDLSQLLNRGGKLLRVLEIVGDMEPRRKLRKNIGDFVNIRYLSLRGYAIKSLPLSIGKLSNLLTLELTFKGTLPNEICYLSQLRHLYAYYYDIRGHALLQNLRNLQTLCLSAGSWIEDCLRKLTNLRKLGILGDLKLHHTAMSISIDKLCSLRSLKLVCANSIPKKMSFTHRSHPHLYKMYLEGLMEKLIELPRNLAKLTLLKSKFEQDAIATLEKLPHLKTLRLLAGSYCSENMICSSGGFLRLEFLEFDCSNLKEWIAEEGSMPSLNRVELHNKDNLRTLPEKVRDLSR